MNSNEPLGLPKGSVRAILALLLVVSAIAANFAVEAQAAGQLNQLAGIAIAFYFGTRSNQAEDKAGQASK